uniref:Uncharacterized protein n=1 Tax=Caenorhabditis tropicalis TaxID=1561998 RepID=A0A1I7TC05_9PELO
MTRKKVGGDPLGTLNLNAPMRDYQVMCFVTMRGHRCFDFPEKRVNSFVWLGPRTTSDSDAISQRVVDFNRMTLCKYLETEREMKMVARRMDTFLQQAIQLDVTIEQSIILRYVLEVKNYYKNIMMHSNYINAFDEIHRILNDCRIDIEMKKKETFQTNHVSYQKALDELRNKTIDHKNKLSRTIMAQRIKLAEIKVRLFNYWKKIETGKLVVLGLKEIKCKRNDEIGKILIPKILGAFQYLKEDEKERYLKMRKMIFTSSIPFEIYDYTKTNLLLSNATEELETLISVACQTEPEEGETTNAPNTLPQFVQENEQASN